MNVCCAARHLYACQYIFVLFCCWFLSLGQAVAAATYTVTTTTDSGTGSLRQAILNANNGTGLNTIAFNIAGIGPFKITPASPLPTITAPVIIDGTTQPGYAGTPLIELSGTGLEAGISGLVITAGGSTVRGLAINEFPLDAIRLQSLGTNVIQGNFLGTDPSGTVAMGNGEGGIMVYGSPGNLIGGTNAAQRNLISGGNANGIYLFLSGATGNVIAGNYLGTTVTGLAPLGNFYSGMEVANASSNLIGGTSPGAGNVISGNGQSGIYFLSPPTMNNLVEGNLIGLNASGTEAISNGQDAVTIEGVSGNTVGGVTAAARNVLSGNMESGVFIFPAGAASNVIEGNYIGTDVTGTLAIPNYTNGVTIDGAAGNIVGGTNAGALNVISGNQQDGVLIYTGASNNMVLGNYIGPDSTGLNALPNSYGGVTIEGAAGNTIGATNGRNVISGNAGNGVLVTTAGSGNNIVAGNYIGVDATGENPLPNILAGVYVQVPGTTIGGMAPGAGNVISGNAENGVFIYGTTTSNNVLEGNFIGTDATGRIAVQNGYSGVAISNAPATTIGGTASGARNVISANYDNGINLGGYTAGTVVQGNYIGTDVTGSNAMPNYGGIYLYGAGTNLIGGAVPGAGNVISGNVEEGISVGYPGANGNTIQGNFIGTKSDGASPLGNQWHNIDFSVSASNNLVGGSTPAADNHIAYETTPQYAGVRIRAGCLGNFISRNSIFSNAGWGIVAGATSGVTISNLVTLSAVVSDGFSTGIQGAMSTYPNGQFLVQIYENISPNLSTLPGYGEGLIYITSTNITTGANGKANFVIILPYPTPPGKYFSATATDNANSTWEFGLDTTVASPPSISISQTNFRTIRVTNAMTGQVTTNIVPTIKAFWPTTPPGFVLLSATNLTPPVAWAAATNTISTNGAAVSVTLVPSGLMSFYRLLFQ
jgi:hypothetical protein